MIFKQQINKTNKNKFKYSQLAFKYCKGKGIEIGRAAHNPFGLSNCINIAPEERQEFWKQSQLNICGEYSPIDIYGTAELLPVKDNSFDYIISSHVIEHVPNPIKAFFEWDRVLKPGGIIFMIFPKRDSDPKDVHRMISSLHDFIEQYINPQDLNDEELHIWVFNLDSMIKLITHCNTMGLNWEIIYSLETDDKVGNGHLVICRKL
jgi:SAM-dependent methyltransferase